MLHLLYNLIVYPFLAIIYYFYKAFNHKIKEKEANYSKFLTKIPQKQSNIKRILIHAASMGEFEQAKPIIESLKSIYGEHLEIISSFYSPSGLNNQLHYPHSDYKLYLPFDSITKINQFLDKIDPDLIIIIRYEFWFNFLNQSKRRNIPLILACTSIPNSNFIKFSPLGKLYLKKCLQKFTTIYSLPNESYDFFNGLNRKISSKLVLSSDTRFERIVQKVNDSKISPILPPDYFNGFTTIVLGSSWELDETLFANFLISIEQSDASLIKLIIVPHEPTPLHIQSTRNLFPNIVLLSHLEALMASQSFTEVQYLIQHNHIVVDSIGKLLSLYSLADISYVGGGFGKGIHSVTEPAGYGIPILCGPKFEISPDAVELEKLGSLIIIPDVTKLSVTILDLINNKENAQRLGQINYNYIHQNLGSVDIIINSINEILKLD